MKMPGYFDHLREDDTLAPWVACFLVGVLAAVFAAIAVGNAIFTDHLVAGPQFVVGTPETDPDAAGLVSVTPARLDTAGTRIMWNLASAGIVAAVSVMGFTGAQVIHRLRINKLFSKANSDLISGRVGVAAVFLLAGAIGRWFLTGRVESASGIESLSVSEFSDFDYDLFVFDLPFLPTLWFFFGLAWIWRRAERLQRDADEVI